jgi:hypothetical protein
VNALRRTLQLQAAVWAAYGALTALLPRFVAVTLFGQPHLTEAAWIRLLGVESITLAMVMVLVAHRIEEVWWWSWAFALMTTALAAVLVLNTAFGLAPGQSSLMWWAASAVAVGFDLALLYGLFVASRGRPVP